MRRLLSALFLLPALAAAGPADLDPSFGLLGIRSSDYTAPSARRFALRAMASVGSGYAALVERDAGDGTRLELLRMDARGITQSATVLPQAPILAAAAHIGPDGRVWLALLGPVDEQTFAVVVDRLLPDGTPDPAFGGGDGRTILIEPQMGLVASAIDVTASGEIAVAGYRRVLAAPDSTAGTFVARFDADGTPVASFAQAGLAQRDLVPLRADFPRAVALTASGAVLVCQTGNFVGQNDALLTRLGSDGEPDAFAGEGTLHYDSTLPGQPDFSDFCTDVDVQPGTGAIVMTVRRSDGSTHGVRRVPVDAQGNAGAAFDNVVTPALADATLRFDAQGRAVLAVTSVRPTSIDVDLVRFAPNGAGDASFGIGGVVRHAMPRPVGATLSELEFERPLLLHDARGRILAGGNLYESQDDGAGWVMLRTFGDMAFADGFE